MVDGSDPLGGPEVPRGVRVITVETVGERRGPRGRCVGWLATKRARTSELVSASPIGTRTTNRDLLADGVAGLNLFRRAAPTVAAEEVSAGGEFDTGTSTIPYVLGYGTQLAGGS